MCIFNEVGRWYSIPCKILHGRTDRRTDRQTDGQTDGRTGWIQYTTPKLRCGGYNYDWLSVSRLRHIRHIQSYEFCLGLCTIYDFNSFDRRGLYSSWFKLVSKDIHIHALNSITVRGQTYSCWTALHVLNILRCKSLSMWESELACCQLFHQLRVNWGCMNSSWDICIAFELYPSFIILLIYAAVFVRFCSMLMHDTMAAIM